MTKQEFESRIDAEVTPEQYAVVEHVYIWHPSIPNVGGKDILAQIYKLGGMSLIEDMDARCRELEVQFESIREKLHKNATRRGAILAREQQLRAELAELDAEFQTLSEESATLRDQLDNLQCGH